MGEHICPCCKTTLGTAWNDRFCNMCEYWQVTKTQSKKWNTQNWSLENFRAYIVYLQSLEIFHWYDPSTKILHIGEENA